jgi:hypothetical protein
LVLGLPALDKYTVIPALDQKRYRRYDFRKVVNARYVVFDEKKLPFKEPGASYDSPEAHSSDTSVSVDLTEFSSLDESDHPPTAIVLTIPTATQKLTLTKTTPTSLARPNLRADILRRNITPLPA